VAGAKGFIHINARGDVSLVLSAIIPTATSGKNPGGSFKIPFFRKFRSMQPLATIP
jgi:hypothetical protein